VIGAACRLSRPADTALLAALDAFHQGGAGASLAAGARDAAAEVSAGPLFHHAVHSGVLWVGLLGQWLPLAPLSLTLLRPWASALSAAQILSYGCLFGYLMRRILPGADGHLGASFANAARRGRIWSLAAAAFSPAGFVHWAHAAALLLLSVAPLEEQLGRGRTLAAFAAAGACAALASSIAQAPFGRRAAPRASTSGAVMGLLALRASLLPLTPIALGHIELPVGRMLLVHLLLECLSNPSPRPRGAERLAGLLGGAALVALHEPRLGKEALTADGWRRLLEYAKELV